MALLLCKYITKVILLVWKIRVAKFLLSSLPYWNDTQRFWVFLVLCMYFFNVHVFSVLAVT